MKKKSVITLLFPSLFMTIVIIGLFLNKLSFNGMDFKGLIIVLLLLLFPLLFLIQGIICALRNNNMFLALGISILVFIILMMIFLNSSALIYVLLYLIMGIIGYLSTNYFIKKVKSSKIAHKHLL